MWGGGALTFALLAVSLRDASVQGGPGDPTLFPCEPKEAIAKHVAAAIPGTGDGAAIGDITLKCDPERYPHVVQTCYWCIETKWERSFNGTTNWIALQQNNEDAFDECDIVASTASFTDVYMSGLPALPSGTYRHTLNVFRGTCAGIAGATPIATSSKFFTQP